MRDIIVILKAASQGVIQAICQGHLLEVVMELKVKGLLEKGSVKPLGQCRQGQDHSR